MKHSTEYLFDQPRSSYEPCLTDVAKKKIHDAKQLLKKLSIQRDQTSFDEIESLIERYQATETALNYWIDIQEEHD